MTSAARSCSCSNLGYSPYPGVKTPNCASFQPSVCFVTPGISYRRLRIALQPSLKRLLMMLTCRMVEPLRSKASRMCQYACSPQPKTVRVRTVLRRVRRHTDAKAVRKAVRLLACRIPRGHPSGPKRVIAPVGRMTGWDSVLCWCAAEDKVITSGDC